MSDLGVTDRQQAGQRRPKEAGALQKGVGGRSFGANQAGAPGNLECGPYSELCHLVEAAVRCTNEAIVITDAQLDPPGPKILFVNEAFCRLTGYRPEEILGQTPRVLQGPETEPGFRKRLKRALRAGRPFRGEVTNYRKDRSLYCAELYISPVVEPGGEITNYVATQREITDRKRAEDSLRTSEERYWQLFHAMKSGVALHEIVCDEHGKPYDYRFLMVNKAFASLTGLPAKEVLGRTVREVLPGIDTAWIETYGEVALGGEPVHFERFSPQFDRHYEVTAYCPEKGRFAVIFDDITDRKRAEQASRESEARLNLALEAAQIGTWVWDVEGGSFHWDERLHAMFGFSRDAVQVTYERFLAVIHREDVERVNAAFGRALDEAAEYDIDFRVVWPDTNVHFLSLRGSVLSDSHGRRLRMTGVCLDITERKRAEEALRNSEARLRAIMETAVDAIIAVDQHDLVESLNPAAERMFGYRARELVGQNVKTLVPPAHCERYGQSLADYLRSGATKDAGGQFEAQGRRADGTTFPLELAISEFGAGETRRFAAIVRDISERKRVEEERLQYLREMEAAKRTTERQAQELAASNAELKQFAYIASHDLQEPLRMVAGYTQLLAKRCHGRLDPEAQEFVAFILDGVKRMRQLITDLLAYSRAGRSETFGPVEVEECVRGSLANLKAALEESHATVEHQPLPEVCGDRTQLTQLFQNLIGNAVKYRGQQVPRVKIRVEPKPGEWLFAIEDNGIGIDPKYSERIFQAFQRLHTREEYAGTGIGLAICKKIVESHGGRIWVESEPGRGSTFFFTLPAQGVPRP